MVILFGPIIIRYRNDRVQIGRITVNPGNAIERNYHWRCILFQQTAITKVDVL